jgi:hypothetical protein
VELAVLTGLQNILGLTDLQTGLYFFQRREGKQTYCPVCQLEFFVIVLGN